MKKLRRGVWGVVADECFLRVWLESDNPKLVLIEKERQGDPVCRSLHCSSCSPFLAVANVNGLEVWDQNAWELLWRVDPGSSGISYAVFSPDGQKIATAGLGMLHVWDVSTRRCMACHNTPAQITAIAFSPDGTRLAISNDDGTVALLDSIGNAIFASFEGHTGQVPSQLFPQRSTAGLLWC
jgi:WD40 repeat protein